MIEAIKIIYDQSNVKEMHFWSELLQLMGIFTYEINWHRHWKKQTFLLCHGSTNW